MITRRDRRRAPVRRSSRYVVMCEWVKNCPASVGFNNFAESSSTFVFLLPQKWFQIASMKNLVLSLYIDLLLGILLLLLGLLLRECLLQDQRVLHLLHQDPGRGVLYSQVEIRMAWKGFLLKGKLYVHKVKG